MRIQLLFGNKNPNLFRTLSRPDVLFFILFFFPFLFRRYPEYFLGQRPPPLPAFFVFRDCHLLVNPISPVSLVEV